MLPERLLADRGAMSVSVNVPARSRSAKDAAEAAAPVVRIRPSSGWRALDLRELWRYRELLWFLALRDLQVRYKQAVLGTAWAVIQPLFTMIVFSIFFGKLGGIPSDGVPYPLFALCALLPWQLFAYALTQSSNSVVSAQRLITKVYFPRLIVPLSSVLSGLVDFAIAFALLLGLMVWYASTGEYRPAPGSRCWRCRYSSCWRWRRRSRPACGWRP